jgi:hypothetical protein
MNAATNGSGMTSASSAMAGYVAAEIKRFLDRPLPATPRLAAPDAPPGAPIGEPAMNWLRRNEEVCGAYWY